MNYRVAFSAGFLITASILGSSCATGGKAMPIFFGRTPKGEVEARDIEKVNLEQPKEQKKTAGNFGGRKSVPRNTSLSVKGVPSRWPVDNEHEVLSPFGPRGSRGRHYHTGFDIRANMRTPVHATADGVVVEANSGGAYGKKVVIDHGGGLESAYAHLNSELVEVGQEVHAGEQIAFSGRSGNATTPHIHYEVRKNGQAVSPKPYLP